MAHDHHHQSGKNLQLAFFLLITAYILWNVIRRLRETMMLFLQGAPKDINL